MWHIFVARFITGLSFLSFASYTDLKTRLVRDKVWMLMGAVAIILLLIQMLSEGVGWQYYLIFFPIIVMFSEALFEMPELFSEGRPHPYILCIILPVFTLAYQIYTLGNDIFFWQLFTVPVMMLLAFLFYYIGLIYGGADAKAMLVLAILMPCYPEIQGFTAANLSVENMEIMQVFFPFTFIVLLNACLLLLVLPPVYLFRNLSKGDVSFPMMFFGYRKDIDDIPGSFVWPMESYEKTGKHTVRLFPKGDEEEMLASLRSMGRKRVWVTPKIPFIVPMAMGFVISFVVGNPIWLLLQQLF